MHHVGQRWNARWGYSHSRLELVRQGQISDRSMWSDEFIQHVFAVEQRTPAMTRERRF